MTRRTALITGCSSGFGLLAAVELARRGLRVFASMRDLGRSARLESALAAAGVSAEMIALDVLDPRSVEAAVAQVTGAADRVDVLVNNAGLMISGFVEDLDEQAFRRQLETNFFGALRVIKAVIPGMRERCYGRIINVSSLGGRLATPMFGAYNASKFALEGLSEALRHELRPYNVFVSLIEPGLFPTGLFDGNWQQVDAPDSPNAAASQAIEDAMRVSVDIASWIADPAKVARAIARAATAPRPRLRYMVGLDARLQYHASRLAPRAWEEWMALLACPPERD